MLLPHWVRWLIAGLTALILMPPAFLIAAIESFCAGLKETAEMYRVWWRYRPRRKKA